MNITVITHTAGNRPALLERCKRSVAEQLDQGDQHIIVTTEDLMQARWDSLKLGDVICWVDDDDYVLANSIRLCKQALLETNVGIAFTNELTHHNIAKRSSRFYSDVMTVPSSIHHLALFHTSLIDSCVFNDYKEIGIGLEWLIKGYLALKYGAIHVPIDGYFWTQDVSQHSKTEAWIKSYNTKIWDLQAKLTTYANGRIDTKIPVFVTN